EVAFYLQRNPLLASQRLRLQRAVAVASVAFWADLYPKHPYGSLPEGTAQSLTAISIADLEQFHRRFYSAGNAVIALVGDIDRAGAERIAQRLASALPQGPAAESTPAPEPITSSHRHIEFNG